MADKISVGQMTPTTQGGDYNQLQFVIQQALGKMQTVTLVKVISCSNTGDISPVGTVDVTPMLDQVDGFGQAVPHGTIFNVPYFRIQGGANAIIIDPQAGDIGICVFANRDISAVKATKSKAKPASARQFSFSDGLYLGGVLNGSPTQWVQFKPDLIKIHSTGEINLSAQTINMTAPNITLNASTEAKIISPTITLQGAVHATSTLTADGAATLGSTLETGGSVNVTGTVTASGDVTGAGKSLATHTHGGVTAGGALTGPPA